MRAVPLTVGGQDFFLFLNARAMFALDEEFDGVSALLTKIEGQTTEGFMALCRGTAVLAEQGELIRRALGYDHGVMPDLELWEATVTPVESVLMRNALCKALALGFQREVNADGEIDLGLVELSQKKTKESPKHYT